MPSLFSRFMDWLEMSCFALHIIVFTIIMCVCSSWVWLGLSYLYTVQYLYLQFQV